MNEKVENLNEQMDNVFNQLEQISLGTTIVDQQEMNDLIKLIRIYLDYTQGYNNVHLITYTFIGFLNKIFSYFVSPIEDETVEIFKEQIQNGIKDIKTEKSQLSQLKKQLEYVDKNQEYRTLDLMFVSLFCIKQLQTHRNKSLDQLIKQYECGLKLINFEPTNENEEEMDTLKLKVKESISLLKK